MIMGISIRFQRYPLHRIGSNWNLQPKDAARLRTVILTIIIIIILHLPNFIWGRSVLTIKFKRNLPPNLPVEVVGAVTLYHNVMASASFLFACGQGRPHASRRRARTPFGFQERMHNNGIGINTCWTSFSVDVWFLVWCLINCFRCLILM